MSRLDVEWQSILGQKSSGSETISNRQSTGLTGTLDNLSSIRAGFNAMGVKGAIEKWRNEWKRKKIEYNWLFLGISSRNSLLRRIFWNVSVFFSGACWTHESENSICSRFLYLKGNLSRTHLLKQIWRRQMTFPYIFRQRQKIWNSWRYSLKVQVFGWLQRFLRR